jgi:hypothetical protein
MSQHSTVFAIRVLFVRFAWSAPMDACRHAEGIPGPPPEGGGGAGGGGVGGGGGGAVGDAIVSERLAVLVRPPPVPVIVIVYVPAAAVPEPIVKVEEKDGVAEVGEKAIVLPAGLPLAESATADANPATGCTEAVSVAFSPCRTEMLEEESCIVKSGPCVG